MTKLGAAPKGRPRGYPPQHSMCAEAAGAIVQMARRGADTKNARANLRSPPRPAIRGHGEAEWWGGRKLAQILGVGGDESAFNRLASGSRAVATEKAVSLVRCVINHGLLPADALDDLAPIGYARAMAPFAPLFADLRALGAVQMPPVALAEKVSLHADNYRSALVERNEQEKAERASLRAARKDAVASLLNLQAVLTRAPKDEDHDIYGKVVAAIDEVTSAFDSISVSTWEVACSTREELAALSLEIAPPIGPDGQPAFASLFRRIKDNALQNVPDRAQAVARLCERVRVRWGIDPREEPIGLAASDGHADHWLVFDLSPIVLKTCAAEETCGEQASDRDSSLPGVDCAGFQEVTSEAGRDQPTALELSCALVATLLPAAKKLLRRFTRAGGAHSAEFLLLVAMTENWYFADQQPECKQSDFEERLKAVRAWAAAMLPCAELERNDEGDKRGKPAPSGSCKLPAPSRADVKRLVNELMRLDVRPLVEMNADLPEPRLLGVTTS